MRTNQATTGLRLTTEWQRNWIYWITLVLCLLTIYTSHGPMADQLVRATGWEGGAYASCVRASCSDRLTDDRPMSRLSDSSVILTSQFRVRSIILMLLLIQMANMSNLSLCHTACRKLCALILLSQRKLNAHVLLYKFCSSSYQTVDSSHYSRGHQVHTECICTWLSIGFFLRTIFAIEMNGKIDLPGNFDLFRRNGWR